MTLWQRAAECYQQAGAIADAARCYERAGFLRKAAELHLALGNHGSAADLFERSGDAPQGAWLLVQAGEVELARACLARNPGPQDLSARGDPAIASRLLYRLAAARCDLAEGLRVATPADVLAEVQEVLAGALPVNDARVREWAIEIAVLMERLDQVALVYAAAVRGRRTHAPELWADWIARHYGVPLVLPEVPAASGPDANG